jgi:thiosulfate dehydrogenase [quinone] large subunit
MKATILKQPYRVTAIPQLRIARFLFADTRASWLWLLLRLYMGYTWLSAGLAKLTGYSFTFNAFGIGSHDEAWVFNAHSGMALHHFVLGALQKAIGEQASVQGWYATFLHNIVLPNAAAFSYLVTLGEVFVGLGLIFGFLTGFAALAGLLMNLNYLFAGTISINPNLALGALLLILAWRVAGYIGCDRYVLPLLSTRETKSETPAQNQAQEKLLEPEKQLL